MTKQERCGKINTVAKRDWRCKPWICGFSSSGRAPPCQGGGSEFEPRKPLHFFASVAQLVEQGTENPRVIGSIPIGGTSSSQATYRLRRFFYKKSSRAHSAAPRFPAKFCCANFCGGPGRPLGAAMSGISLAATFFAKSRRRAHSAAAPSPHEILLRKLSRGPRPPQGRPFAKFALLRRFFCKKSFIRLLPCSSFSPRNFAAQTFAGAPAAPWGRL